VTRQEAVERLRLWATRAQHEATEADTWQNGQQWQGQAQALGGVATFLAGQSPEVEDKAIWREIVADRERALAEWLARQETTEAPFFAGAVAGYDTALTAIKDMSGRIWPRIEPHVG
jgi:hypothetical protein